MTLQQPGRRTSDSASLLRLRPWPLLPQLADFSLPVARVLLALEARACVRASVIVTLQDAGLSCASTKQHASMCVHPVTAHDCCNGLVPRQRELVPCLVAALALRLPPMMLVTDQPQWHEAG
jgi:hypothetical protein